MEKGASMFKKGQLVHTWHERTFNLSSSVLTYYKDGAARGFVAILPVTSIRILGEN